jgi:hypothetical protein
VNRVSVVANTSPAVSAAETETAAAFRGVAVAYHTTARSIRTLSGGFQSAENGA